MPDTIRSCCWCQAGFFCLLLLVYLFYLYFTTNRFINIITNINLSIHSKDLPEWIQPLSKGS